MSQGLRQIISSVLAAAFGVQSEQRRAEDFQSPQATPYLVVGVIITLLLILGLAAVVRLVLRSAGV